MGRAIRLTVVTIAAIATVLVLGPPSAEAATLRITEPPSTMSGTVTVPYSYTFTVQPGTGTPPYHFRLHPTSGPPPSGLTLADNGVLSGTPTALGTWVFRVMVVDGIAAASATGQITFNVGVLPMALGAGPTGPATALVNFQHQFTASGGMPPYTFSKSGGALPSGVTLQSSGLLVGVPHEQGTFTFTVQAKDNLQTPVSRSVTLTVVPPAIIGLPPTTPIPLGQPFSFTFTTTPGRIGTVSFQKLTGFLPPGITLSPAGVLSGRPTAAGAYRMVVVATFTVGNPPVATFEDYRQLTLTVAEPAAVTTATATTAPSTPAGTVNGGAGSSATGGPIVSAASSSADINLPAAGTTRASSPKALPDNAGSGGTGSWPYWAVILLVAALVLAFWWWRRRRSGRHEAHDATPEHGPGEETLVEPTA